jgi:hypothetical protein
MVRTLVKSKPDQFSGNPKDPVRFVAHFKGTAPLMRCRLCRFPRG